MHSYRLVLPGDISVQVEVPVAVFDNKEARLLAGAYLPGVSFPAGTVRGSPVLNVAFREAEPYGIEQGRYSVVVNHKWHGDGSLLDLIHLLHSAARLVWLKDGLYPVHSACVGDPEKNSYVLVVGHSGSGKTSTALELANRGLKIFSANKTLVQVSPAGTMIGMGGTRTITTNAHDVERHGEAAADNVAYKHRSAFLLDNSKYAPEGRFAAIHKIALVRLNDGAKNCSTLETESALHRLYPFFLDTVNADTILCGGSAVFTGELPALCQPNLIHNLKCALANIPVLSVTGSMDFVAATLKEQHG
ncbi:MAG: hypothetical protein K2W82_10880 [Candidatus Obscuribacterales bacterium]|nr:hypothetical protein [Candidatus Obscuribacterales bacterium]